MLADIALQGQHADGQHRIELNARGGAVTRHGLAYPPRAMAPSSSARPRQGRRLPAVRARIRMRLRASPLDDRPVAIGPPLARRRAQSGTIRTDSTTEVTCAPAPAPISGRGRARGTPSRRARPGRQPMRSAGDPSRYSASAGWEAEVVVRHAQTLGIAKSWSPAVVHQDVGVMCGHVPSCDVRRPGVTASYSVDVMWRHDVHGEEPGCSGRSGRREAGQRLAPGRRPAASPRQTR